MNSWGCDVSPAPLAFRWRSERTRVGNGSSKVGIDRRSKGASAARQGIDEPVPAWVLGFRGRVLVGSGIARPQLCELHRPYAAQTQEFLVGGGAHGGVIRKALG